MRMKQRGLEQSSTTLLVISNRSSRFLQHISFYGLKKFARISPDKWVRLIGLTRTESRTRP